MPLQLVRRKACLGRETKNCAAGVCRLRREGYLGGLGSPIGGMRELRVGSAFVSCGAAADLSIRRNLDPIGSFMSPIGLGWETMSRSRCSSLCRLGEPLAATAPETGRGFGTARLMGEMALGEGWPASLRWSRRLFGWGTRAVTLGFRFVVVPRMGSI